jgi:hypothetical protein
MVTVMVTVTVIVIVIVTVNGRAAEMHTKPKSYTKIQVHEMITWSRTGNIYPSSSI